ncbi:dipicolinate synthase subunit DpsA [Alicyclobacillus fastidiosus]|uniref:Dipicolinate synthase subunit DpsA n=1 Tax=Alicyclobacillus fastidiosus TaxID=392011 RepID=A0ABV5AGT2_9BACL|nr:dipicolinate synthase subunit DpsA [Alicyclobacillus fastidiosus]WEH07881.1 dipicolinate synthase subunit DpsA [Alicyclobacillus fastidiosus]
MLTGKHLVFVGGDARQLEVIAQVVDNDASATLVGFSDIHRDYTDTVYGDLTEEVLAKADALVLPIAGMENDGRVDTKFAAEPIMLTESHFAAMRPGAFVFTGIARSVLTEWCNSHSLQLVKLMELDEVAILNSIPTAEGAIAIAMEETDITLHGANTVVLGFGRCGQTLAHKLRAMGANVRVCARYASDLARVDELSLVPVPLKQIEEAVRDADIVFNTIPALVLNAGVLREMARDCVIIDIASKPGGTDFRYAERRGMRALLAPSLPGLVAPKTAGRIIARSLSRILAEESDGGHKEEDIWS